MCCFRWSYRQEIIKIMQVKVNQCVIQMVRIGSLPDVIIDPKGGAIVKFNPPKVSS